MGDSRLLADDGYTEVNWRLQGNARFQNRTVWKHTLAIMCSSRWAAVEIGELLKPGAFFVTNPAECLILT
jgi:hypothetical protein